MQPPPQRPCRFLMNCRDFAQGNCRFSHGDTGNMPEQPRGGNYRGRDNYDRPRGGRGGFQNGRNQGYQEEQQGRNPGGQQQGGRGYQGHSNQEHGGRGGYQGVNQGGYQGGYQGKNQGGYQGGYQGGNQGGNQGGYQGNNFSQGPKGKIGGDNINQQFCRTYQLNGECQHGDRCNRKHGFTFDDNIRRLQFLRNIPSELQCKLTAFFALDKNYISLRNGNQVTFCEYSIEGSIFNEVGKWSLPNPTIKYHYFTQKGSFIYFASENPKSAYVDLGFYDIFTKKMFIIENGHQNKITGMAHFMNGVLLSASLDGDLKVWNPDGEKYVVDKPSTERLKSQYNPMNTKTELMFVNVDEMLGTTIISCGTSNNRLFLFIGTELIYKQVIFDQQYSKIYEVRFLQLNGQAAALVLAWNHNSTASAILGISLADFMQTPLIEVQTDQDKPKLNIRLFEVLDDHLFVANGHGFVTIYRLPDFKTKVGCINHQNALSGIVMVKGEIKTTSIMARHVFILEMKQQSNEGSLGVYLLKL